MRNRAWCVNSEYADRNRFKAYAKKHRREYSSCFANLDRILSLLSEGLTLDQIATTRFFSSEGGGLFRIGQTGVKHARETRLYVFVHIVGETVYVLTIGDKDSQQEDIRRCRKVAETIREGIGQ